MVDVDQLKTTLAAAEERKPVGDWSGKPAIPASTVAVTNDSDYVMWVEVVGGTVTVVAVDGVTTGRVVGAFFLRPGSSIAMTYSVVPTSWKWFAL
jgi:hypothetical protein